jgi:hypothetical protein
MSFEELERLAQVLGDGLKTFDGFVDFALRGRVLGAKPCGESGYVKENAYAKLHGHPAHLFSASLTAIS